MPANEVYSESSFKTVYKTAMVSNDDEKYSESINNLHSYFVLLWQGVSHTKPYFYNSPLSKQSH